jgi:hypothetical protein
MIVTTYDDVVVVAVAVVVVNIKKDFVVLFYMLTHYEE